jgi:hypothetical protein
MMVVVEKGIIVKKPSADQIWAIFWEIREVKAKLKMGKRLGRSSLQIDEDYRCLMELARELTGQTTPEVVSNCRSRLATIRRRVYYV